MWVVMARGRPPLPAKVRELHGERRPSRTRVEPQPRESHPEAPACLSEEAREVWDRLVVELEAMGLLYRADTDLLAGLASSVAAFAEAERKLAADGRVYVDSNGQQRRSPWVLIRREALDGMMRLGSAFGLSPQARAHVALSPTREKTETELLADRLLS